MSTADSPVSVSVSPPVTTPAPFVLSPQERAEIEQALHHYPHPRAASIDALKIVQRNRRWVEDGAIAAIAEVLGIAAADLDGVATFYNRIYRRPVGRHVISVCDSIGCFLTGFEPLYLALRRTLGIEPGETTADGRFTLLPISCLGGCDRGPVLMVDDTTYFNVSPAQVSGILERHL
jgi:NADH-quinone oxidoreductase subunit E